MKALSYIVMGALALAACRSSEAPKKEAADTQKTASAETTKKKARQPKPVDEGIDVPTEEDFEEAVASQITTESDLDKELDQLEKEIGK